MNLTKSQQEALDAIFGFLLSNEQEFFLLGPAGSGKTQIISSITSLESQIQQTLAILNPQYVDKNVRLRCAFTGLTHEATSSFREINGECTISATIHSFLGLRPNYVSKTTRYVHKTFDYLRPLTDWVQSEHKNESLPVLVIDECSLMDPELYGHIQVALQSIPALKVIYIGDPYQLPPVNEQMFQPFLDGLNNKLTKPHYFLTEVVRQDNPVLKNACQTLRQELFNPSYEFSVVEDGVYINRSTNLLADYINNVQYSDETNLIVGYTNSVVNTYQKQLEQQLPKLNLQDKLYFRISNNFYSDRYNRSNSMRKGSIFTIKYWAFGASSYNPEFTTSFYNCSTGTHNSFNLACLNIQNPLTGEDHSLMTIHPMEADDYFKTINACIAHLSKDSDPDVQTRQKLSEYYLKLVQYPRFEVANALTIHKSQGKTFDNIYIDMTSFKDFRGTAELFKRLLYVAFSRARKRVYIYEG